VTAVAPPTSTPTSASTFRRGTNLAVGVLVAFVVVLTLIPARLVFAPLGAFGTPAAILGLVALGLWALTRMHPGLGGAFGPQPARVVVLGFCGAVLASYVAAQLRVLPAVESRGADRGLLQVLALSGVALLAMDGLQTRTQVDRLLRTVVVFAAIGAGIGILQFIVAFDVSGVLRHLPGLSVNGDLALVKARSALPRVSGTATHPIEFGVVCAMVFPVALHFAMRSKGRLRWWIPPALLGIAIPMSISRSGILALAVGVLVYAAVWTAQQRIVGAVVALIALAPARFVAPGLLGTLGKLFMHFGSDPSVTARTDDYATTTDTILGHLWFGRGLGTYLPPTAPILDNQLLGQLVETGIVGLVALVLLAAVGFGTARGARRRSGDPQLRDQAQALAAALIAGFVTFLTYDFMAFALGAGLFFVLLGCIGALWRISGGARSWAEDRCVPSV